MRNLLKSSAALLLRFIAFGGARQQQASALAYFDVFWPSAVVTPCLWPWCC